MSSNMACVNNIRELKDFDFDEDKEMAGLAHTFKMMRLGKQLRETSKLDKELNAPSKNTHKKSKNPLKY